MPNVTITPPLTVKEIVRHHDITSWLGVQRNVPPEPVFSLCHLVLFFSFSDMEGQTQAEEERQRRGGQIALGIT